MDVSHILLALGQQAQSSLWSQHYAQQNIDSAQQVGAADKPSPQQVAEHMALLQYWSALSRQQQDHFLSQQTRPYPARSTASQPTSALGPEAMVLLSQLQHFPGGAQALASYLSAGSAISAAPDLAQRSNPAHSAPGTDLAAVYSQARWPYTQEGNPVGAPSQQQPSQGYTAPFPVAERRSSAENSPLSGETGCRGGPGSSASSEGDIGAYQVALPRERLENSPQQGAVVAFESAQHSSADRLVSGLRCAKEKNRAAQRRFRERQKGLITALKSKADTLAKQVEEQKKTIEDLRNDKQTLQTLLEAKQEPE